MNSSNYRDDRDPAIKAADITKSVHLSASAGSGKTRCLKDRYLGLIGALDQRGLNIDQAVAITFTDKAAAEIEDRVLHGLTEPMLKKIVRGKQDLRISTIHAFCMNLLKRYPLEAGLPPDFGVLDERDRAYLVEAAIERSLEQADRNPQKLDALKSLAADELTAILKFLLSIRSRLKRIEIDAGGAQQLLASVQRGMALEQADAELQSLTATADWRTSFQQMELILRSEDYDAWRGKEHARLADTSDAGAAEQPVRLLASFYFTKEGTPRARPFIPKKSFKGKNRKKYEETFAGVQNLLLRFRDLGSRVRAGREASALLRLFLLVESQYQDAKLREGLVDFDDLEIFAYRLLQDAASPEILYWLDRKVLHFLVDEFQDTSDIQWAILNKLTEETFSGAGADKPMQPTLFVVGDDKQSIYRFREANYRLLELVRERMERNLLPDAREILTLDKNFRSAPELVELVNQVFTPLWGDAYVSSRAELLHRGSVCLIEVQAEQELSEANALAEQVATLVGSGAPVFDKTEKRTRPAGYGDCAILIQSRTGIKEIEAALQERAIPFRVIGGVGFYEEDEIQALISVLFYLWNNQDMFSLAVALKSQLFGCSDANLADILHRERGQKASLAALRPEHAAMIHAWQNVAGLAPIAGLLHRIVQETGAYVRFGRRNPQAIFNIDKLLDTAREFDRKGYTTLQDFTERVRSIRESEQREAAADMTLPGMLGAISIMTVHKAKGLEYPIVFLPGMNRPPRAARRGPEAIAAEAHGNVRFARKDASSPLYAELWELEKEELKREHQRLLYVAMTRARDHLVMVGKLAKERTPVNQDSWLFSLRTAEPKLLFEFPALSVQGAAVFSFPIEPAKDRTKQRSAQPAECESASQPLDADAIVRNLAPVPHAASREWKRATDFIEDDQEETGAAPSKEPAAPASISPLVRGTVLHRCLEHYTKQGSYDLGGIIRAQPGIVLSDTEALLTFERDVAAVLSKVLANADFGWLFANTPGSYSELPFLCKRGHDLVSGIVDRFVIMGNTGRVVDYKAIQTTDDASRAAWCRHYEPQIRIYCDAMKAVFRLDRVEGSILFLDSNELVLVTKV